MEGLEISIVNKSEAISITKEDRWDSEYYVKSFLLNEKIIHSMPTKKFTKLCSFIKKGIFDLPPSNYLDQGIPLIRTSEIKNPTIDFNSTVFISKEVNKENHKTILNPADLVFTKIGAFIGDVAMLPSIFSEYNISQNVAGAKLLNSNDGPYLLAFFLSSLGKNQILRSLMLSGQGKLELEDIRNYEIPIVSVNFKKTITNIFDKKELCVLESDNKYKVAENIMLEAVGLSDFKANTESLNVKSFKDSFGVSGRLDAEYYQKKYEGYENLIKKHKLGYTDISSEYDFVKSTSKKEKKEYNYIEISDVNSSDGTATCNLIDSSDLPANAKIEVKCGDLLISKVRPYRGAVSIIDFDVEDIIVSGAFTVIREKPNSKFSNETLKVLLRTDIYKDWLLKFNIGTQYPVIKDEDILNLPIPKIPKEIQERITNELRLSRDLKNKSTKLLETAKQGVEIAIEEGEEKAMKWIEKEFRYGE